MFSKSAYLGIGGCLRPRIAAIICSLNRADYLQKALRSLAAQTLSPQEFEIIVVDNGSTDSTQQVIQTASNKLPHLRYCSEPVRGLSRARNRGWQKARAEYIAYLDDDAVADPDWLEQILKSFVSISPQPGGICGQVSPIWEAERPPWLSDALIPWLSIFDLAASRIVLEDNQHIVGANMAFPRHLLESVGGFEVSLGRKGKNLLSNEEPLVKHQIQNLGYVFYYDPQIKVRHHIPSTRLHPRWFLRRTYWQGISDAILLFYRDSVPTRQRIRLGITALRQFLETPQQFINLFFAGEEPLDLERRCASAYQWGYIVGLLTFLRSGPPHRQRVPKPVDGLSNH